MSSTRQPVLQLKFHPLVPNRWHDLEQLFGDRGACGGCWCMYWKLNRSQYEKKKGRGNRKAFKRIVDSGEIPGIIAYSGSQPIAWCAIAPREKYQALERSRILKPVDEKPVWSVVCFFVSKGFRRQGLTVQMLKAAVDYARRRGAKILEGYPVDPKKGEMPDVFAYTGLARAFLDAGFVEVLRRSETRPIMRYIVRTRRRNH